jgi:hypothetical protein
LSKYTTSSGGKIKVRRIWLPFFGSDPRYENSVDEDENESYNIIFRERKGRVQRS